MKSAKSLYMFAFIPPLDLSVNFQIEKTEVFEKYKFTNALKPLPHITMYNPFLLAEERASSFERTIFQLQKWADKQASFQIDLNNFSFFENPKSPVVFIAPINNHQLKTLYSSFIKELTKYIPAVGKPARYKPHVTIGS